MSIWGCEKPKILKNSKKMPFEKEFTPYPHFIVYYFETILPPLNEHPTVDLTYQERH